MKNDNLEKSSNKLNVLKNSIINFILAEDRGVSFEEFNNNKDEAFQLSEDYIGYSKESILKIIDEKVYEFHEHLKCIDENGVINEDGLKKSILNFILTSDGYVSYEEFLNKEENELELSEEYQNYSKDAIIEIIDEKVYEFHEHLEKLNKYEEKEYSYNDEISDISF